MNVSFDGTEGPTIEHFARSRNNSPRGEIHDAIGAILERIVYREKRAHVFGQAQEPYGDFGDQCEGSFRTDHEAGQIVAGRLAGSSAELDDLGVRHDQFQAGDVVGCDAVSECVRPAGIFGDIAAYSAGLLTGRIRSEVPTVLRGCA